MLSDLLKKENIIVNLESTDKEELFAEMLEVLINDQPSINRAEAMNAILAREQQMSTCVRKGVAVPHASCDCVSKTVIALGISRNGIEYDSIDEVVHLVFMVLFEQDHTTDHLQVLSWVASDLQSPELISTLINAKSSQEAWDIIREYEIEH